eukprot:GFUD01013780.1.p1 GENE.GFUD01013780.1~~GFUD01013780.1.p1  ORF type:complete len:810 (+),score=178.26 GFUD01013780.1:82-2511(+)
MGTLQNNAWKTLALQFLLFNLSLGRQQSVTQANPTSASEPSISSLAVRSHITLRYAETEVESLVKNPSNLAKEVKFSMFLPDSAFISNFTMIVGKEEHVATVMEKKDAVEKFNSAKKIGIGAGLVSQNERDSNKFSISTNIEGGQKVVFLLKYEELLERRNGQYEHAINIHTEGVIDDLKVEVFINESLPLSSLIVPELKQSNEIDFARKSENKDAKVMWTEGTSDAHILYAPDKETQRAAGEGGVSGQFLVRYDVDRKGKDNEVQVIDGYFVHFFTPDQLQRLAKHTVFVLDISGSMMGEKIVQLKDAMFTILDDMTEEDFFSIIVFSSGVSTWSSDQLEKIDKDSFNDIVVIQASEHNKNIAIKYVNSLSEGGGTNINDAMLEGITLAEKATKEELLPANTKSMIIFLTDGDPTVGERNSYNIRQNVRRRNTNHIPIFCLAFGRDSDFSLMKEISREADSFAKRIYEGSDAAIQLEDFFSQISSPLISDLTFEYLGLMVDSTALSKTEVNTVFRGGEYVVVGRLNNQVPSEEDILTIVLKGEQRDGKYQKKIDICLRPRALPRLIPSLPLPALPDNPLDQEVYPSLNCLPPPKYPQRSAAQNFMKKLHAFVNIKQLLKEEGESSRSKALQLSLENNFVTELTSLVVVAQQDVKIVSLAEDFSSNLEWMAMSTPSQRSSVFAISAQSYGSPGRGGGRGGISAQSYGSPGRGRGGGRGGVQDQVQDMVQDQVQEKRQNTTVQSVNPAQIMAFLKGFSLIPYLPIIQLLRILTSQYQLLRYCPPALDASTSSQKHTTVAPTSQYLKTPQT